MLKNTKWNFVEGNLRDGLGLIFFFSSYNIAAKLPWRLIVYSMIQIIRWQKWNITENTESSKYTPSKVNSNPPDVSVSCTQYTTTLIPQHQQQVPPIAGRLPGTYRLIGSDVSMIEWPPPYVPAAPPLPHRWVCTSTLSLSLPEQKPLSGFSRASRFLVLGHL